METKVSAEHPAVMENINIIGKGVTDPHIRIFDGRAYLYASHDDSIDSDHFVMKDWQVWSSRDLLDWNHESTLKPEDTYIGKAIDGCWATDALKKNGKYYWCFSEVDKTSGTHQIGIVEGTSPTGPWEDAIGNPLLSDGCVDTEVYDPCLFEDDDGSVYLLFGVWDYFIVKMADDMRSVDGEPQPIGIKNPQGPYGKGKTDDKVFLHKHQGTYYLSWGSYYATSEQLIGPYLYRGCIVDPERMEERFQEQTWPHGPTQGRHGSFFEWNNQWFFTYCEMCFSGNRYFRDFWISYVHYRKNGEIEPIAINSQTVGTYDSERGKILAAEYFKAENTTKVEVSSGVYEVQLHGNNARLEYPKVRNAGGSCLVTIHLRAEGTNPSLHVLKGNDQEELLSLDLAWLSGRGYQTFDCLINGTLGNEEDICLKTSGSDQSTVSVQWLQFSK